MLFNHASEVLKDNGFSIEITQGIKNGETHTSITIGEGRVRPTIWDFTIEQMESEEELIKVAKNAIDQAPMTEGDMDNIFTREYVKNNVYSCVRPRKMQTEELTRETVYDDIEEYFRVRVKEVGEYIGSYVVKVKHLQELGITVRELTEWARKNTHDEIIIENLAVMLERRFGLPMVEVPEMYVMSNERTVYGAGGILQVDILTDFCRKNHVNKITILPSSIHEVILIVDSKDNNDELSELVREVNASQVAEDEQLGNKAYTFSVDFDEE